MKKLGVNELREKYLKFFEGHGHFRMPSFSLVPEGDKSLLLINAGMAPLKPYFMGTAVPPAARAATCQKCIRTGDIEEVGKTARHGTFFEMLGNFSFADYFKREAIQYAWDFVIRELEMPLEKLYFTVFLEDDEAEEIWHKEIGVPKEKIFRMGREDNWCELTVGPCGPCSEIFYDRGPEYGQDDFVASVTAGEDRYMEFWNLVFIQFYKDENGNYSDLPAKGIDTGMGLERIALISQGVDSIFDIDTMRAVRDKVCELLDVKYAGSFEPKDKQDASIRMIVDHARSVVFMMSDGITPGNGDREYVLKRLLRRAALHGSRLGAKGAFLSKLAQVVIDNSKHAYPELEKKAEHILKLIDVEEKRFYETLESGMTHLKTAIAGLKGGKVLAGADAFKLHDTYGFPLELTREILEEQGLGLDEDGFDAAMQEQKERARTSRADAGYTGGEGSALDGLTFPAVEFVGYTENFAKAKVVHVAKQGEDTLIILDKTPVYAEAGGQKADFATIKTATGTAQVTGCVKIDCGQFAHITTTCGEIQAGQDAEVSIDVKRRADITRNHTATHLLHAALCKVLGDGVTQAGASKSHDSFRFDFNHFEPMTKEEITAVEDIVNDAILRNLPVRIEEMPIDDAKKRGAIALFGEKYGDTVRVVDVGSGEWVELCGGTHLAQTGGIGAFKIVSESGIAAGVRRIEAVAGIYAIWHFRNTENKLAEVAGALKSPVNNVLERAQQLLAANKELSKQLEVLKQKDAQSSIGDILKKGEEIGGTTLYAANLDGVDMDGLRKLSDDLIGQMQGNSILLLAATADGKGNILARATKDAVSAGVHCGNIVKAAATAAGGGGGGRPDMAQAGIKDISKMDEAVKAAKGSIGG